MHDHLGSNIQNSSQKFGKNFFDFEKPQKFSKPLKVRSEMHEMYDKIMKRGSYLWNMQDQNQRRSGEKDLEWFRGDLGGEEAEWIKRDRRE